MPKGISILHSPDTCSSMFAAALFTIARKQKQPKCTEKWMTKMWYLYLYTHNEYYSTAKNKEIMKYADIENYKKIVISH